MKAYPLKAGPLLIVLAVGVQPAQPQSVYTLYAVASFAGTPGSDGSVDGTGSSAWFYLPHGVAVDVAGTIYVADTANSTIRKITPARVVTTLAGAARANGSTDGSGSNARFYYPFGIDVDRGGTIFVADTFNHTVRKISQTGGVTTLAGLAGLPGSANGTGSAARFYHPTGVAVDPSGSIYVADEYNHTIRKITPAGVVTTFAGLAGTPGGADGIGTAARFYFPYGIALDKSGAVYVGDSLQHAVRKISPAGAVTTLAGQKLSPGSADGTGSSARFNNPSGLTVDSAGNVYVADGVNHTIRRVTPEGVVSTLAGLAGVPGSDNGIGSAARFGIEGNPGPADVAIDAAGNLYIADQYNDAIRRAFAANGAPVFLTTAGSMGFDNGAFGFELAGPPGRDVVIEASVQAPDWIPILTNTFEAGILSCNDPQSASSSNRFYRAYLP